MPSTEPRLKAGRVALLALLLAVGLLTAVPAAFAVAQTPTHADYWKGTAERRDTVYRFVYRQSPQAIPSSYDVVQEAEQILRQGQRSVPANNPRAPALWQQTRDLTTRSALSPRLRALGTVGLAVGAFDLGWKIGSGINARYLRVGLPDIGNPGTPAVNQRLAFQPAGATLPLWHTIAMPEDGWAWEQYVSNPGTGTGQFSQMWVDYEGHCQQQLGADHEPPAGMRVLTGNVFACTYYGTPTGGTATERAAYMPEDGLPALGAIEDYTDQRVDRTTFAPEAAAQPDVEQSIDDALDDPDSELIRQWLNYSLGSPGETDPLEIGSPNPEIEFPGFVKHWRDHGHKFTTPYLDPAEYWRDAADIVERYGSDPDILRCQRASDDALIYWDSVEGTMVIVKDGKIVTYFPPDEGFDYWVGQCGE